ncbi:hypothetical protein [Parvularcula sp. LCG005]|uniref:hypothetical protein n=1 Tax=Parvularcula sp. LCG005 TaxID=3078805 RepID=UPI0029424485|nr:hypothetical protein [Parvularcula sp. LCG005]WOI52684.1 hypothetical protein RUI03_11055 [Parvularcula sp. LCG005]
MEISATVGPVDIAPKASVQVDPLRQSARDFEAAFIMQMLQHSGIAEAFGAKEGGTAEGFSSFLLEQIAGKMADQGGFGLAEQFYQALSARAERAEPGLDFRA